MLELLFLGGAGTVTGSKHLLRTDKGQWLVDCGLYQGPRDLRLRNWQQPPVPPAELGGILLTHAHIDHIGYLPRVVRDGLRAKIWSTPGTAKLARILLPDSGRLQEEEASYHNRKGTSKHKPALPLYTGEDGEVAARRIETVAFGQRLELEAGVAATFHPAGHILGSAEVRVEVEGKDTRRILFSGDLGRYDAPILPDPSPLDGAADYVVMESTYGDRMHDPEPAIDALARVVNETAEREGALVVPAFAVGRTQELLFDLDQLERAGRIPRLAKYVDSPMAVEATRIYFEGADEYDEDMKLRLESGPSPLSGREFRAVSKVEESRAINQVKGPVIILSASGMATGGRVLHHLRQRLPDPRNTVLLVGYQAVGTRGRTLQEGGPTVRIFGEDVPVRARVETIHGFSAHADAGGLLRWLSTAERPPRRIFLVHGDPVPAQTLAERIRENFGWDVVVPGVGDRFNLE